MTENVIQLFKVEHYPHYQIWLNNTTQKQSEIHGASEILYSVEERNERFILCFLLSEICK